MNEHNHPLIKWEDGLMVYEFNNSVPLNQDNVENTGYNYYTWPYYYWPCCYGTGHKQTMEINIEGKKVIITGKDLVVKVEEVT